MSMSFTKGKLSTDPSPTEHRLTFPRLFEQMEDSVFKNQFLNFYTQDLSQLFFWDDKRVNPPGSLTMRRSVTTIEQIVRSDPLYNDAEARIDAQLTVDLKKLASEIENYKRVQEIYDFNQEWNAKKTDSTGGISLEMGFYKETWAKMDRFQEMIENLPAT